MMNLATRLTLVLCVLYVAFLLAGAASQLVDFIHRYFLLRERKGLYEVYAGAATPGTWAVVTGASSGQGREFALQLADRGFHLLLLGSVRCEATADLVRAKGVECTVVVKDFGKAFEPGFFDDIQAAVAPLDVAVLVNNVGFGLFGEGPVRIRHARDGRGEFGIQFRRRRGERRRRGQRRISGILDDGHDDYGHRVAGHGQCEDDLVGRTHEGCKFSEHR